jgi:hypothetical protein
VRLLQSKPPMVVDGDYQLNFGGRVKVRRGIAVVHRPLLPTLHPRLLLVLSAGCVNQERADGAERQRERHPDAVREADIARVHSRLQAATLCASGLWTSPQPVHLVAIVYHVLSADVHH